MKNTQINKPTISDYNKIEDFSNACIELQKTLSMLNNHIEIVKRTGDTEALNILNTDLSVFLRSIIISYKNTLSENEDKE